MAEILDCTWCPSSREGMVHCDIIRAVETRSAKEEAMPEPIATLDEESLKGDLGAWSARQPRTR